MEGGVPMTTFVAVKHNIEVAHRLFDSYAGKCENIHGHSMWVTMHLNAVMGERGMATDPASGQLLEFGQIKHAFREHLDENYDHRLLLNASDPWSRPIFQVATECICNTGPDTDGPDEFCPQHGREEFQGFVPGSTRQDFLPGLQSTLGDPTTENIAKWIGEAMRGMELPVNAIEVWETSVNNAMWMPDSIQVIDESTVRLVDHLRGEGRI
jgi:6-pyruvoyl-tetrahydropterin synthase